VRADRGVGEREHEVGVAGAQLRNRVLGLGLLERHLDAGVRRAHARERAGHERCAARRERHDPHASGAQAGDRGHLLLGRREPREHGLGVLHERAAGVREPDAAAEPRDQRRADLGLQARDVVRDRGLRVAERPGGRRHGPLARHRSEHLQAPHVEHARQRISGNRA